MKTMASFLAVVLLISVCQLTTNVEAQDWHRFRGPNGAGVSSVAAPTEWSPEKNVLWKAPLPGAGVSCPVVLEDRIFLTCYSGYGLDRRDPGDQKDLRRHVVCISRKNGDKLWSKTIEPVLPEDNYAGMGVPEHGYASHTPVTDGKHVYVFLGKSGVIAYDLDGNEIWKSSVGTDSDDRRWGSASSPILLDDLLIVPAIAENSAIVGLDKATGKQKWIQQVDGLRGSWGTPILVKVDEKRSDIVIGVAGEIWGLNPKNGKLRWLCGDIPGDSFYTSVVAKDGVIYGAIGGRSGGGSFAVKAGGKGDVTDTHLVWSSRQQGSFASPLVHNEQVFVIGRGGAGSLLDAENGESIKQFRLSSNGGGRGRGSSAYSSPVIANNKFYYVKRNGETIVHSADEGFEQIAVNKITNSDEVFSASPAISEGQIFIRSDKHLYCVSE